MSVSPRSAMSRETRLLVIVIAVSAVALFVLSRFRFPDTPEREPAPTAAPLERLAARATFDELASIIADLGRRVSPAISVLHVETDGQQRFVPAARVRPDAVLAHVSGKSRILGVVGSSTPPDVMAFDPVRELVLLRVGADPANVIAMHRRDPIATSPRYVAAVEGTRGGPTLRPVFLGRTDPVHHPRFNDELMVLGGVLQATPGSLIFALDGSFVGLCIMDEGFVAGVTGPTLDAAVTSMLAPPPR